MKPKVIEGGVGLRTGGSHIPAIERGMQKEVSHEKELFQCMSCDKEKSFGDSPQGRSLFSMVLVSSSCSSAGSGGLREGGGEGDAGPESLDFDLAN